MIPSGVELVRGRQPLLYQEAYGWFIFLSALDVMFTWIILHVGGREVNPIAQTVIHAGDLWGVLVYKFVLVIVVILACEAVGARRIDWGRNLAHAAVAISALPVVLAMLQLLVAGPDL